MEFLLLCSSFTLAKWVLWLKGKNSISPLFLHPLLLGWSQPLVAMDFFLFFILLLCVPTIFDLVLVFFGIEGEASSSLVTIRGTLFSSIYSSSNYFVCS